MRLSLVVSLACHLPMVGGTRRRKLSLGNCVNKTISSNLCWKNSSIECWVGIFCSFPPNMVLQIEIAEPTPGKSKERAPHHLMRRTNDEVSEKENKALNVCVENFHLPRKKSWRERRIFFSPKSYIFWPASFQKRKIRGSKAQSGRVTMEKFTSK